MSVEQLITQHINTWTSALQTRSTAGRGTSGKIDLYGIKKLRELILELAVRGKLVPQDPSDEPASELLKQIAKERDELVKSKVIRKSKSLEEITNAKTPFELPDGWEWCYLNDIGNWGAGSTPNRSNPEYYNGNIPWFKSGELTSDFISHSEEKVTELALQECSLRDNKVGDVLIAMYGATIGKTSILNVRGTTNQAVCACTPYGGISNTYLLTLLKAYKRIFIGMGAGGAQPNISREKLIATVFALPPKAEQNRIICKINELMSLCDQLEQQSLTSMDAHSQLVETLLATLTDSKNAKDLAENWARISQHFDTLFTTEASIDALKQTILQLAVTGKLVPQDPNDEPVSELLERIEQEKNRLVASSSLKTSASYVINSSDVYLHIPESWGWVRLGNIARFIDYRGKTPNKLNTGIRLITAKNIRNGYIDLQPEEFISENDYVDWMTRGFPKKGDLLFTTEAPLGNAAIIDIEEKFALAQRAICLQWHMEKISPFMLLQFMSGPFQNQLIANATGMTAMGIKASKLKEIPVIVPPLKEQYLIVKTVKELFTYCDTLKSRLQSAQQTQLHLADALTEAALS
ncbi:Type I restriction-modification system, specificity subunit S [Pantoea sp. AS-PWVM4]|uniref:restriction endonuclease subunit S n=1 Tax=Pantoea sp. AS-PWVM4 TaxID=1332069 RepID=UPI0003AC7CDC|nr:restriction endonuclease subunit S [Pantoea sp. AS-PWVM4]ERK17330.1 Type I restriction-modification system, specificity subunit S [Pantoea sp. AS-PWVM4]